MPDGLFSNQKSQFGWILEGLAMEKVGIFYVYLVYSTAFENMWSFGIFYGHLIYFMVIVYFMAIWYVLWSSGIYYSHLVYVPILWSFGIFSPVLVCCTKKNLATLRQQQTDSLQTDIVFDGYEIKSPGKTFSSWITAKRWQSLALESILWNRSTGKKCHIYNFKKGFHGNFVS
jgi:hypothetical protein